MLELKESNFIPIKRKTPLETEYQCLEDPEFQDKIEIFILNAKTTITNYINIVEWWGKEIKENFKLLSQKYSL
jgi:hypothetical protein